MWFSGSKKFANGICNLLPNNANIAQFQVNLLPKSCLNPSEIVTQKTQSVLARPGFLGMLKNSNRVLGIEDNSYSVLGVVHSNSRVLGIAHDPWNKIVSFPHPGFWFKRVHIVSGEGHENVNGMEDLQKLPDFDSEGEDESGLGEKKYEEVFIRNVEIILGILNEREGLKSALKECGLVPTSELVEEVLSKVWSDWEGAYAVFMWAGSHPDYQHSLSAYHLMISILGKHKKFDIAWELIRKMQGKKSKSNNVSMVTFETLLIMMKRYSAVHDVAGAIRAFDMLERFKLKADVNAFHALLSVLCRYKNVEDAELLLYYKKSAFGYDTESFNIVLNGWCNMVVSITRAKRFWKVMINNGIYPDARSFSCMICCFSKLGKVHEVLRLFDEMKKKDYAPDLKVYNAVFHALAKRKFFKEAYHFLKVVEEKGFTPNDVTYNSLIKAFCEAERLEDAYMVFYEMIQKGIEPSITTFHAIFRALKDPKEVMELFDRMINSNCTPTMETFIMLIRKFCRCHDSSSMIQVWNNMSKHGYTPDRNAYVVLIKGLFLNDEIEEAHKYYEEMKVKGFSDEPMFDQMISTWIAGRELAAPLLLKLKEEKAQESLKRKKIDNTVCNGMSQQRVGRDVNQKEDFDWTKLQKMDKLMRKKNYGF